MSIQNAQAPIRIVIADDQTAVREGLGLLLGLLPDIEVVAQAGDGDAAIEAVARHAPQVVLMDLHMPRRDGIEATRAIRADHPEVQVVILTTYDDDASILHALQAGALGFLTKDATQAEIGRAVAAAAAGQAILDPTVQTRLLAAAGGVPLAPQDPNGLTARETDVLRLIVQGQTNREIARTLFVTEATVKTHINRIFAKTASRDRAAAVRYAYSRGIAERPASG
ncbi:response regulator transcription factor [Streptomyces sp. CdTB01]|uniref:response regulator transcription factor n=1 Tax=Streptomyces sp. CdTB01 TaxID=1725411 RepID=UPI00073A9835|nr:response regulator transcription factor [Streptomyces sp. CdTB01]ALV34984.1 LuxR family transcriptional regulator [Streptomyces sp. CdTB01]